MSGVAPGAAGYGVVMQQAHDHPAEPDDHRDGRDDLDDLDAETIAEDAIDYFGDAPGPADSPADDTDAPPPG